MRPSIKDVRSKGGGVAQCGRPRTGARTSGFLNKKIKLDWSGAWRDMILIIENVIFFYHLKTPVISFKKNQITYLPSPPCAPAIS